MKNTKNASVALCCGAVSAALYVTLTYVANALGLASNAIQFRISEMLCILPVFLPGSTMGLFIGCFIANLTTGALILDTVFGSIATLAGALGARLLRRLPKKLLFLTTVPTILANVIVVPLLLLFVYELEGAYIYFVMTVFIGELVCAGILGSILLYSLKKCGFRSA